MVRRVWCPPTLATGTGTKTETEADQEDGVSRLVGGWGLWQLLVVISVSAIKLSSGWVQLAVVFLTPPPRFWCVEPPGPNGTCVPSCQRYAFDAAPLEDSIVTEWALVCERAPLASLVQSALQLGILLGSIVFGWASDRAGRRRALLWATLLLGAAGLAQPLSPGYWWLVLVRLLLGAAAAGTMVVAFVLVMETVGPRQRHLVGCFFQLPFIFGHMTLPLFAYYCRSWRALTLSLAVPQLAFVHYYWTLPESPRWLLSAGRAHAAATLMRQAATLNKRPSENLDQAAAKLVVEMKAAGGSQQRPHYTALMRRGLRARTGVVTLLWLLSGLSFFGFNQYIGQTSADMYTSVATAAAIQLPANLACVWLLAHAGRRYSVFVGFLVSGLGAAALQLVPAQYSLAPGALGVSGAALACTALYVHTSELFPTVVRNMALGAGSTGMRVGAMLAPWAAAAPAPLPPALFAAAPLLAALLALLLPDTAATALPHCLPQPVPTPPTPTQAPITNDNTTDPPV